MVIAKLLQFQIQTIISELRSIFVNQGTLKPIYHTLQPKFEMNIGFTQTYKLCFKSPRQTRVKVVS